MTTQEERTQTDRSVRAEVRLYYDVHAPDAAPAPLLVALHGYGSNKGRMMRDARACAPEGFAVASLQGPHQHIKEPREPGGPLRYGFGWLTSYRAEESVAVHHRALLDVIGALVSEGVARADRVFLLGFSQTCALNFRFAFTHAEVLRGCVGVCGGLPGDWETGGQYARTDASVLYLHGARDEFYTPSRVAGYESRLRERASEVEVASYDAGHEMTPEMHTHIRSWLATRAAV